MTRLRRQINIRMSDEDVKLIEELQKKKGWSRSRAMRYLVKFYGEILRKGEVYNYREVEKDVVPPDKCPECKGGLFVRAGINTHGNNIYDELWECDNCHTIFRVLYKPIFFTKLKEA